MRNYVLDLTMGLKPLLMKLNIDHFRSIVVTIAFIQLRLKLAEQELTDAYLRWAVRISMQIYAE